MKKLQSDQLSKVVEHISSLKVQGKSFSAVREAFDEASIKSWSSMVNDLLSGMLFTFVRKAFQQQLPTASNLYRWKKSDSDKCSLCGLVQTNKHSLNNCGSSAALSRYKTRHDRILEILARWIITSRQIRHNRLTVFIGCPEGCRTADTIPHQRYII